MKMLFKNKELYICSKDYMFLKKQWDIEESIKVISYDGRMWVKRLKK